MRQAFVLASLALALAGTARADDEKGASYHAVIDRVDLEPASIGGLRLLVYLSALTVQGQLLDLSDPKSVHLYLGSSEKKFPVTLGTFDGTSDNTDIIVLVQATTDFTEALPLIGESLEHVLLDHVADRIRVAIVMYGEGAAKPKWTTAKQVRGKVALASDGSVADPSLCDAIDLARRRRRSRPRNARRLAGREGRRAHPHARILARRSAPAVARAR